MRDAASIRLVSLPAKDLTAFVEAGARRADVERVLFAVDPWQPVGGGFRY